MSLLWPWVGVLLAGAWAARCLQVGCGRWLPVAGLLFGVSALWTVPGRALQAAVAEWLIVATQLLGYAAGPLLAAGALWALTGVLGRVPVRAGSAARWLLVAVTLLLGIVGALLVSRVTDVTQTQAHAAATATGEFAVARAAELLAEPASTTAAPPSSVRDDFRRVACVAPPPAPVLFVDPSLEARWC